MLKPKVTGAEKRKILGSLLEKVPKKQKHKNTLRRRNGLFYVHYKEAPNLRMDLKLTYEEIKSAYREVAYKYEPTNQSENEKSETYGVDGCKVIFSYKNSNLEHSFNST